MIVQAEGADRRSHAVPLSVMPSGHLPAETWQHFGVMRVQSCAFLHGIRMQRQAVDSRHGRAQALAASGGARLDSSAPAERGDPEDH